MLGLDQKTLRPLSPGADDGSGDTDEQDENERIDRERLAWTCKFQILSAALKYTTKYNFFLQIATYLIGGANQYPSIQPSSAYMMSSAFPSVLAKHSGAEVISILSTI